MAEILLSVLLEHFASIALQEAEKGVRLVVGVEEEVGKLESSLRAIKTVLEDAEKRQVEEENVKLWLDKLKDVSYDMDDVLDEWNTALLNENAPMPRGMVCSFVPSCFCFRQVALRHDIAVKIKELNKTLDVIVLEKDRYSFNSTRGTKEPKRPETSSLIDVSEVYGRDHDKNKILDMLLNDSSQGPALRIISLVGMGGIGKTTLAQLVYNDDKAKVHFDKRIWVCVSDPFDELRIAKAIVEALTKDAPNLNTLESLLQHVHESIEGKKFLLVLDDVWTEDSTKWVSLKNSLKCGSPESRILVTTRKETVAKNIETTNMFQLGHLSDEECWSLFSRVAFFGRNSDDCKNLEVIGRGIANKCKGLPLAANVMGSLLRFKITKEEWQSVLDSEVWKLEKAEVDLFPHLLLSYYDLSFRMRRCFSYCAIFPKDYEIEKDRLIMLWMAQGYFGAKGSGDMEMVGEECFGDLAMRSFFQDIKQDIEGWTTCKMHDIVHDFAQFLTKNECVMMEVKGPEESRLDFPHVKARHLMLMGGVSHPIPASIKNAKKLRSLIVESQRSPMMTSAVLSEVFDQLTCLRTLDLSPTDKYFGSSLKELPKKVEKLIHLRYLKLAGNNELKELPETVCDLFNLQTLDVSFCESLEKLPHGLGKLINLRHLQLMGTINLGFIPKGVERLTCLRTLDWFVVSSGGNVNEAATLEALKNLKHLRGSLCIRGLGKVRDVDEIKEAQLMNKEHLIGLILDFNREEVEGRMINDEQVIEAIQPPPNLEELCIGGYRSTSMSLNWMTSLTNLKKFEIYDCEKLEALPDHLLHTTSLKELAILCSPIVEECYYKEREGEEWPNILTSLPSELMLFMCKRRAVCWRYHSLFGKIYSCHSGRTLLHGEEKFLKFLTSKKKSWISKV